VAVPTNHRDEVAQLMADYRRGREQLASVQRALRAIAESVTSPDGLVTATVDSAGTLAALTIADDAYRLRPSELADTILRTTRSATVRAAERARQALAPILPAGTDPAALLTGRADLTEDEIDPPARPLPVDEDTYENATWMDRGRA
jgi:DNA-binding protein YbaB